MEVLTILALFVGLMIATYMVKDSRDRKAEREIQIVLFFAGLLFGIFALFGYWLFRPTKFSNK